MKALPYTILSISIIFSSVLTVNADSSIDKAIYLRTMNNIKELYRQDLKSGGFEELNILDRWENQKVGAGLNRTRNKLTLVIDGGLARDETITSYGLAAIVCHEIGHGIGGAPSVRPANRYSSEAQSDYFATSQCLKRYFGKENTDHNFKKKNLTPFMKKQCLEVYSSAPRKLKVCLKTMLAIDSFKNYLIKEVPFSKNIALEKKDTSIAKFTIYNKYPKSQCRIDTFLAGALNRPRPACWFNAVKTDLNEKRYENRPIFEAVVMSTIHKIKETNDGCFISLDNIFYHKEDSQRPLSENEIWNLGVHIFGQCPYEVDDEFSGVVTKYTDKIYQGLQRPDL